MTVYFAPMEGITGRCFRNAYETVFPGRVVKYFAPFIASSVKKGVAGKDKRELAPENNRGFFLVPQLLTNDSEDFVRTSAVLRQMGYDEINLNLGCPSRTVVSKGRGAGMLIDMDKLDHFLEAAYACSEKEGFKLSLKTRLGMVEEEEFVRLLSIYDRYPVSELIIHLRLCSDYYKLPSRPEWFAYAGDNTSLPLVYNGDILCREDMEKVSRNYPNAAVMIGRGLLMRPWMLEDTAGANALTIDRESRTEADKLWEFHDLLYEAYQKEMSGERNVLFKMKEIWTYLGESFDTASDGIGRENKKALKQIRKSQKLSDYEGALTMLRRFH